MLRFLSFFVTAVCLLAPVTKAQTPDLPPLQVDRANNTFTPTIVQKGFVQVESGLLAESDNNVMSFVTPGILLKYGVNKKFEIRLSSALLWQQGPKANLGAPPLLAGIKASLTDEKGVVPQISFLGELAFDEAATTFYKTKFIAPRFRFLFQHTLSKKISLAYNAGMEWNGFTPAPTARYTFCGTYNFTDKFSVFAEIFGEQQKFLPAAHYADLGFMFWLNSHSVLDISGGPNIAGAAYPAIGTYYYVTCGYSFRFNTVKKVETIFVR